MKKSLLTTTLLLIVTAVYAQQTGANLLNVSYAKVYTDLTENTDYKTNFNNSHRVTIGFQKDIRVSNRFFISPGIGIQRAGFSTEVESKNSQPKILKREISGYNLNALLQLNFKGYIINKDKWRLFSSLNYEYNYGLQTTVTTTDHTSSYTETTFSSSGNRLNSYINNNYFGLSVGYEKQYKENTFWYTRVSRLTNTQGYKDEAATNNSSDISFNTIPNRNVYTLTVGIGFSNKKREKE